MARRKYDQVLSKMKQDIFDGRYETYLPGVRVLADTYSANFKTVNRVMKLLEDEGLLKNLAGTGRLILPEALARAPKTILLMIQTRGHLFGTLTGELIRLLHASGYSALPVDTSQFQYTPREVARLLALAPLGIFFDDSYSSIRQLVSEKGGVIARKMRWTHQEHPSPFDGVTIQTNHRLGVRQATRHLIEMGHRRILYLHYTWVYDENARVGSTHKAYMQGYEEALAEAGIASSRRYVYCVRETFETSRRIREVFSELPATRPTALVAYADFMAVAALREIQHLGLRVPEDVAVVGYNNTPWTDWCEVPLTSVSLCEDQIARIAVENLTRQYQPGHIIQVNPQLVVRRSSNPLAPALDSLDSGRLPEAFPLPDPTPVP
jgi:DNA-binding LacI/PurR family transcriptional regulator